jgi:hypothetical protein
LITEGEKNEQEFVAYAAFVRRDGILRSTAAIYVLHTELSVGSGGKCLPTGQSEPG